MSFITETFLSFAAGISGEPYFLYHRPGNYVILPCDKAPDTCSMVTWFYNREPSQTTQVVYHGDVKNSTQAARLSLHSDCSLCINNITTEDAGVYNCRPEGTTGQDTTVYLNILTSEYLNINDLGLCRVSWSLISFFKKKKSLRSFPSKTNLCMTLRTKD